MVIYGGRRGYDARCLYSKSQDLSVNRAASTNVMGTSWRSRRADADARSYCPRGGTSLVEKRASENRIWIQWKICIRAFENAARIFLSRLLSIIFLGFLLEEWLSWNAHEMWIAKWMGFNVRASHDFIIRAAFFYLRFVNASALTIDARCYCTIAD